MNEGDSIVFDFPDSLYLSLVTPTKSKTNGNFNIQYSFIDRDPNDVISRMSSAELARVVDEQYIGKW